MHSREVHNEEETPEDRWTENWKHYLPSYYVRGRQMHQRVFPLVWPKILEVYFLPLSECATTGVCACGVDWGWFLKYSPLLRNALFAMKCWVSHKMSSNTLFIIQVLFKSNDCLGDRPFTWLLMRIYSAHVRYHFQLKPFVRNCSVAWITGGKREKTLKYGKEKEILSFLYFYLYFSITNIRFLYFHSLKSLIPVLNRLFSMGHNWGFLLKTTTRFKFLKFCSFSTPLYY